MDYNEVVKHIYLVSLGMGIVNIPIATYMLIDSVKKGLSARWALRAVEMGDDYRNHRWTIDDARSYGIWIAWAVAGGKSALEKVLTEEGKIDEELGFIRNN